MDMDIEILSLLNGMDEWNRWLFHHRFELQIYIVGRATMTIF